MNGNNSSCRAAEYLWMKSNRHWSPKSECVRVVWLQSHAFQEVSSQEIFLFKPSAIHEPHFWNEPTKLSQPHSFNKTPTTVCPGSNQQPAQIHWFSTRCCCTGKWQLAGAVQTNMNDFYCHTFSLQPSDPDFRLQSVTPRKPVMDPKHTVAKWTAGSKRQFKVFS